MNGCEFWRKSYLRSTSLLLSALMTVPVLASCGGSNQSNLPPIDDSRTNNTSYSTPQAQRKGISNGQKVAILAGAAALYYLYNQHQNRQGAGAEGQYYLSKNGRVYYRDAQGRPHWVTPPREGIQVPAAQAERYREFQGYNGRQSGRDLRSLPETSDSYGYRQPQPAY